MPTTKTCLSERNTLLAVIGVALWIWVMAHAGLSAIMHQLRHFESRCRSVRAVRVGINFLKDENVRIRACQQIDLFLGLNQWYFDCIQRAS